MNGFLCAGGLMTLSRCSILCWQRNNKHRQGKTNFSFAGASRALSRWQYHFSFVTWGEMNIFAVRKGQQTFSQPIHPLFLRDKRHVRQLVLKCFIQKRTCSIKLFLYWLISLCCRCCCLDHTHSFEFTFGVLNNISFEEMQNILDVA